MELGSRQSDKSQRPFGKYVQLSVYHCSCDPNITKCLSVDEPLSIQLQKRDSDVFKA